MNVFIIYCTHVKIEINKINHESTKWIKYIKFKLYSYLYILGMYKVKK